MGICRGEVQPVRPDRYGIIETLCVTLLFVNVDQKDTHINTSKFTPPIC